MQTSSTPQSNPLDQLKDIHVPDGVNSWPLDWGWWCLGIITLMLIVTSLWWLVKRYKFNRARREALTYVTNLSSADANWPMLINTALKRTAMSYFPTTETAQLNGQPWVAFLASTVKTTRSTGILEGLTTLQSQLYISQPNKAHFDTCQQSAMHWIKNAKFSAQTTTSNTQNQGNRYA